jgi:hypothetical protein
MSLDAEDHLLSSEGFGAFARRKHTLSSSLAIELSRARRGRDNLFATTYSDSYLGIRQGIEADAIRKAIHTTAPHGKVTADGQLLIGSSTTPNIRVSTLTAGVGIAITNGHGSITIAATGSEQVWTDESMSFNALAGNGYFVTGAATATLPAAPTQGNQISFAVDTASQLTIQANTGQFIRIGNVVSASAGTAANNARGDSITLVYRASDTTWISVPAPQGTWTVT